MKGIREKAIAFLVIGAVTVTAAQAMPTGSFLRRPAQSKAQLISQVQTDPVVRDRFMRHFRMSREELVTYFNSLHLAKLANTGTYTVYNVHADNVIRSREFNLKAGTLVYADASGRPILKHNCGNPLVFGVPPLAPDVQLTANVASKPTDVLFEPEPVGEELVAEPEMPAVIARPDIERPVISAPVRTTTSVIPAAGGAIGGLLFLPLIFGLGGGRTTITKDCECPPVPEPATILVMTAGAGMLALRKRRQSKA